MVYIAADLDFADPAFGDPRLFIRSLHDKFGTGEGTVIIDEFQNIPLAGLFLKTIHDSEKGQFRFIVSGSSSLELTKNAEFLTGRKMEFLVLSFSFREFVRVSTPDIPDGRMDVRDKKYVSGYFSLYGGRLKALYADYLHIGGYPDLVLSPADARLPLLQELISTYLHKDVAGFLRVENIIAFNNLIRLLASRIGSQVNRSELSSTLRLNQETLNRYLDIIQGTYVAALVAPWYTNPRKEISKMPKVYLSDPAFARAGGIAVPRNYSLLDGHRVENAVYLSLLSHYPSEAIKYYRTASGSEVDFIVETGNGILPLGVKFTGTKSTEPLAMRNFKEKYTQALSGVIITKDHLDLPDEANLPLMIPAFMLDFIDPEGFSQPGAILRPE